MLNIRVIINLSAIAFMVIFYSGANAGEKDETGKNLYQAYCSQCHGLEGDGFGVNSYDIDVNPRDHTDTSEMMARTDADLMKAIKFGGKAVDKSVLMPNWDGNLTDAEVKLIIGHLRDLCCKGGE